MTPSADSVNPGNEATERVVVVSGMSGAGKSTALHALEDLGYFCVDNLPTTVVAHVLEACRNASVRRIALGIDVRLRAFLDRFGSALEAIQRTPGVRLTVLFLDASDQTLLSRRPHPLSTTNEGQEREALAVLDGINAERQRLAKVRVRATDVIDTTALTVHDLRHRVVDLLDTGRARMRIRLLSFGFKYGPPVDADLMLDVRFLPNPYFVDGMRQQTGLDEPVLDYVMGSVDTKEFLERAHELVSFCVPRYEREGKAYLTIAMGCTGGRHRSVAIAGELGRRLEQALGVDVRVVHRDIQRDSSSDRASEPDIIGGGVRGTGRATG
ncbi:MAG: RNase adapter RapZ [Myxococcota bacterium]